MVYKIELQFEDDSEIHPLTSIFRVNNAQEVMDVFESYMKLRGKITFIDVKQIEEECS